MTQVLSQQEIDSLLAAVESGEIDEEVLEEAEKPKIKEYDFRRPVRLSKEYISTLSMIFEEFAKITSNILSTQVRSGVTLQLASIEQISFDEFVHSVPRFTLLNVLHAEPLEGVQVIEVNPQVCLQLVELLCGSSQEITSAEATDKDSFTEIEFALLEDVGKNLAQAFQAAWSDIVDLDVSLEAMETNAQMLQNMSPNEPIVLTTFTTELMGSKTFINLCIPYLFFETILDKLSFRNWFHGGKEIDHTENEALESNLQDVKVNTEVLLGQTEMPLENFLQLEVGDIIQLDGKTSQPLVMSIEHLPYCLVKPGVKGKNMAIEILQYIGGETANE